MDTLEEVLLSWSTEFAVLGKSLECQQCRDILTYIQEVEGEADRYKQALYKVLSSTPEQGRKIAKKELGYK